MNLKVFQKQSYVFRSLKSIKLCEYLHCNMCTVLSQNGNSPLASLQNTPLFTRKAATISSATSKKYFA